MAKKRGQTWSIETYLAIGVFLIALVFFYSLTLNRGTDSNVQVEVEELARTLMSNSLLKDGVLSQQDLNYLYSMNCSEWRQLLKTTKNICIYLQDGEGNLLVNSSQVIHGFGCPSINISGMICGQQS